jgi:hypothetical protein
MARQLHHPQGRYPLHLWQVFVVGRCEFSLSLCFYFDHISRWAAGEKEAAASEERLLRYLDGLPVAAHPYLFTPFQAIALLPIGVLTTGQLT